MAAKEEKSQNGILETIKTIVYALLLAGLFRSLLFQPFWIPSGSMKSTLLIGDFLFVNKMAYGYSYASCPSVIIPAIGINVDAEDLCGFMKGNNKRLLGGEPQRGDVVGSFKNRPRCSNGAVGDGGDCVKTRMLETLPNGVTHEVLDIGRAYTDDTAVFTVPEGHFFFMGDNRDNSLDSRVKQVQGGVGFVPYEDLIGRADRIMFSSAGRSMLFFWTWRGDRFFQAIY
ncbi:MAG: signal peptidase I [Rhodobacteraceae bacterium]|nr:signal peptidase I [Paracoccaceae bacterium]